MCYFSLYFYVELKYVLIYLIFHIKIMKITINGTWKTA